MRESKDEASLINDEALSEGGRMKLFFGNDGMWQSLIESTNQPLRGAGGLSGHDFIHLNFSRLVIANLAS